MLPRLPSDLVGGALPVPDLRGLERVRLVRREDGGPVPVPSGASQSRCVRGHCSHDTMKGVTLRYFHVFSSSFKAS